MEVKAKTKEHLVGRARIFNVPRLNLKEYIDFSAPITKKEALQQMLIYGSYPAVAKENKRKQHTGKKIKNKRHIPELYTNRPG